MAAVVKGIFGGGKKAEAPVATATPAPGTPVTKALEAGFMGRSRQRVANQRDTKTGQPTILSDKLGA